MKKSILIGALALFAIGTMSIQNVEAQNPVKKSKANTEMSKADKSKDKKATPATKAAQPKEKQAETKKCGKISSSEDCCNHSNNNSNASKLKMNNSGNAGNNVNSMVKPDPTNAKKEADKPNNATK